MKTVEDLTELNKIKLNQLFKYINNYIFQAIRSKKHFYCFDNKKNIGCNLYKIGRGCSLVCIKSKEENFWYTCTPLERKDDIRVRYIKLDYRIYLFK